MSDMNEKLRAAEGDFDYLINLRMGAFNVGLLLARPVKSVEDQQAIEANNIAMLNSNGTIPPAEFRVPRSEYVSQHHILVEIPESVFEKANAGMHYVMPAVTEREGLNRLGLPYETMQVGMLTQRLDEGGAYDQRGVAMVMEKAEYRAVTGQMLFNLANRREGAQFLGFENAEAMLAEVGKEAYVAGVQHLLQYAGLPKAEVDVIKGHAGRSENYEFLEAVTAYQSRVVGDRVNTPEPGTKPDAPSLP